MYTFNFSVYDAVISKESKCAVLCNQQSHLCRPGRGSDPGLCPGGHQRKQTLSLTFRHSGQLSGSDHLENPINSITEYTIIFKFIEGVCVVLCKCFGKVHYDDVGLNILIKRMRYL